jgi:hypothetical protein
MNVSPINLPKDLDRPDDPRAWAPWLEEHLAGLGLAELVEHLKARVPTASGNHRAPHLSIKEVLGGRLADVLEYGLSVLPPALLREHFLEGSERLYELHELVFTEGGAYWEDLLRSNADDLPHELCSIRDQAHDKLLQRLEGRERRPQSKPKSPAAASEEILPKKRRWARREVVVGALVGLMVVVIYSLFTSAENARLSEELAAAQAQLDDLSNRLLDQEKSRSAAHDQERRQSKELKEKTAGLLASKGREKELRKERENAQKSILAQQKTIDALERQLAQARAKGKEWKSKYDEANTRRNDPKDNLTPWRRRAEITRANAVHNVSDRGQKGMLIQVDSHVDGLKGQEVTFAAFFFFTDGKPLPALPGTPPAYVTPDRQVTTQLRKKNPDDITRFTNVELFIPYDVLSGGVGPLSLKYYVAIQYDDGVYPNSLLDRSPDRLFTIR